MKRTSYILVLFTLLLTSSHAAKVCSSDSVPTLNEYITQHSLCLAQPVLYEGCRMQVSSDGRQVLVRFSVQHPMMQMRILMQGLTLYIDPTGKKRKKYAVVFPSGADVHSSLSEHGTPPSMMPPEENDSSQRADIAPLLFALNQQSAAFIQGKQAALVDTAYYAITLSEDKSTLTFSVLLPCEPFLAERALKDTWRIGMWSEGGRPNDRDGMGGEFDMEPPMPSGPTRNRPGAEDDLRDMMAGDLAAWTAFSFSKACSVNE